TNKTLKKPKMTCFEEMFNISVIFTPQN
ncbi:MAG: hypothetical protein JWP44_4079, partial [Mucilaginibacter sp.]|nr:hypothetical protein [Mucilaginibacter sp.]